MVCFFAHHTNLGVGGVALIVECIVYQFGMETLKITRISGEQGPHSGIARARPHTPVYVTRNACKIINIYL